MARSTQRNRRSFQWARAAGFALGEVQDPAQGAVGGVDLLASIRGDYGGAYLRGATVMAVKGWIRPYVEGGIRINGVAGIRVCNYADLQNVTWDQTPGGPLGGESDWMAYWPYDVAIAPDNFSMRTPATWNHQASVWGVDVQSSRRMNEAGYTLGLFWNHQAIVGDPEDLLSLDYHLSIGLKLA